jgi:phosphoribosyl 1,2-cyclic phosphate phosphodiesterase
MKARLIVMGSGTSMGVPTIGCECQVCASEDPRDQRTRPSVLIEYDGRHVLIDTTPDFRQQAIRERVRHLDAVLYTHAHADHILGLDDLRPLSYFHPGKIPLYADERTGCQIRSVFRYIFEAKYKYGGLAQVELHPINGPIELFGATFEPITVMHGDAPILAYRFGQAAYVTDFSEIPEVSMAKLEGLDILFLDALRHKPHPTHSTVENSLRVVDTLKPKRAFFTHICHDLGHEETNATLPAHVRMAYDGMNLEFEIGGQ